MEKKLKILIIIIIFTIIIVTSILIYLLSTITKGNIIGSEENEIYYSDQDTHFRTELEEVTYKYDFFDTIACIQKYTNSLQKLNKDYYKDENTNIDTTMKIYKEELYNMLDKDYIEYYNLTLDNIDKKLKKYYANMKFSVDNMYVVDAKEELSIYFVYGKLINIDKNENYKYGFIVKRDTENLLFSILPYEYMIDNDYKEDMILNKNIETIKNINIQENDTNYYISDAYDTEYISSYYFDMYKLNLGANIESIYNKIDEEYKSKRFPTLQSYKTYVEENYTELVKCNLNQYNVETDDSVTNYICKDQFDNYYIFKETQIGKYTIVLDTYTLEYEKYNEKYKKATNKEKVAMNITKFFQMINEKDYESAYSVLAESFKNKNFKTQDSFKQYIKTNLYSYSDIELLKFSDEISGLFTYNIEISDKDSSNKIKMNIIMELLENTDYRLSFEIVN